MAEEQVKKQENTGLKKHILMKIYSPIKTGGSSKFLKNFLKRKTAVAGLIIIFLLVIIAIIGPYITPS